MERRTVLAGIGVAIAAPAFARAPVPFGGAAFRATVAALDRECGGRFGVAVLDTGTGAAFAWRGDERFPMCSTFKAPLAAAVLARVDRGRERLDHALPVTRADLVPYAPFTETRVGGTATIAELCAAAVSLSDNAAANLLLVSIGGPAGLTRFLRTTGDATTRLDRTEPTLNTAIPGDPRDTTTPRAMAATLARLTHAPALSEGSRGKLIGWMEAATTGGKRLRAGAPSWRVADKTGTGSNGTNNVIALLWPPDRAAAKPLIVTSYCTGSTLPAEAQEAIHAQLARAIVRVV